MFKLLLLTMLLGMNAPAQTVGWYNGDWQPGAPGLANFSTSGSNYSRVYDDFVVPEGGWTVIGVFSQNRMDFSHVTKAAWEIRKDMDRGKSGKKVASGTSRATEIPISGQGPFQEDQLAGSRIQVDGLRVRLKPGRYWVSVAPVGRGVSYVSGTVGKNAVGNPTGNNGSAMIRRPGIGFTDTANYTRPGRPAAKDFSLGVIIEAAAK